MNKVENETGAGDSIDYRRGFLVGIGVASSAFFLPLIICALTLIFTGDRGQNIPVIVSAIWLVANSWLFKRIHSTIRARVSKIIPESE